MAASNVYNPYHVPVYDINSNPKGICLIINNTEIRGLAPLASGAADKENLLNTFGKLQFEVGGKYYWDNLTSEQMKAKLEAVSKEDHTSFDCFVCCINAHGCEKGVFGSDKKAVDILDLTYHFRASNCPSLAGKPKLFFIDSCRGTTEQSGSKVLEETGAIDLKNTSTAHTQLIPDEADFLLGYATAHTYRAYEHPDKSKGSRFFSSLTWHLDRLAHVHDILEILTMVNMAVCSEWYVGSDGRHKIQTPAPMFTLCKKLYLGLRTYRVLIVGPSESGKNMVANAVLEMDDQQTAEAGQNEYTPPLQTDWRLVTKKGRRIEVTEMAERPGSSEKKFRHELTKAMLTMSPGPHVVLLCYRADLGFSVQERHYEWLMEFLGDEFMKFAVLVFLGQDDPRCSEGESRKVLENMQARHRKVVYNIKAQDLSQQRDKLLGVLDEVLRQNAGRFFSNKELKSYDDEIQKLPKTRTYEDLRRTICEGEHCDLDSLKKSASSSLLDSISDILSAIPGQNVFGGINFGLDLN